MSMAKKTNQGPPPPPAPPTSPPGQPPPPSSATQPPSKKPTAKKESGAPPPQPPGQPPPPSSATQPPSKKPMAKKESGAPPPSPPGQPPPPSSATQPPSKKPTAKKASEAPPPPPPEQPSPLSSVNQLPSKMPMAKKATKGPFPPPPPPAAPPEEPPPPTKPPGKGDVIDRTMIQPHELLTSKANLKRVNRKDVMQPVTFENRDLFYNDIGITEHNSEHLPLRMAKHNIMSTNRTSDLTCLNMSGVEMLTDAFFYILRCENVSFYVLKKVILSGCHHLTDLGMKWMAEICPQLMGLDLDGCSKVTEKGLTPIVKLCSELQNLEIIGTNVGRIPIEVGKTKVTSGNMRTQAAPIISSGFAVISRKWKSKKEYKPSTYQVVDKEAFKVVVLRDQTVTQTLMDTVEQKKGSGPPPPMCLVESWQPKSSGEKGEAATYILMEVSAQSMLQNTVVSPGSIVILTYQCGSEDETTLGNRLAATLALTLAKSPDVVVMTLGLPPATEQKGGQEKLVQQAMTARLMLWRNWEEFTGEPALANWRLETLDFSAQLSLAEGGAMFDTILQLTHADNQQLLHMSAGEGQVEAVLSEGLQQCVSAVKLLVPWVHDPLDHSCFEMLDKIPRKVVVSQHAMYHDLAADVQEQFEDRQPYPVIGKILDFMEKAGSGLYYPGSDDSLCVTDMPSYTRLISAFLTTGAPKSESIACLADTPVPCWDKAAIDDFLKKHGADVQVELFLKVVVKQGVVLPVRCKSKPAATEESSGPAEETETVRMQTVYVPVEELPEAQSSLSRLWPEVVPSQVHHADLFFNVLPALPAPVLVSVMRHILKIFKPCLLWKTGMLIQQGPVDILIQLCYNHSSTTETAEGLRTLSHSLTGTPALVISARIPTIPHISDYHGSPLIKMKSNKCLWGALQTVQTICEYVFLRHHLYAFITMPCNKCCEFTLAKALDRNACFHFDYNSALASESSHKYVCRQHKHDRIIVAEKCGPRYSSIVPFHKFPWLQASNNWRKQLYAQTHYRPPDPEVLCFLCEEGTEFMCQHCYMCNQCVQRLAKVEKYVKPGFIRPAFFEKSWINDTTGELAPANVRFRGSMVSLKKHQVLQLSEPLTPVYFNRLAITVFRGYDYIVKGVLVNGKMIKFKGLSGSFLEEDGTVHGENEFKSKEGVMLEIKIHFSKVPGKSVLTFHMSGRKIIEHEVEGWEVRLIIKKNVAGSCLLQAAGVKPCWQANDQVNASMGNTVEYVSPTDPTKVSKAVFTTTPDGAKKGFVTWPEKTFVTSRDVNIRPVGYAKLKGLELTSEADPKVSLPPGTVKFPLYLWKFSQHQVSDCLEDLVKTIKDPLDLQAKCRTMVCPSAYYASMEANKEKIEEALFTNGRVDYSDTAIMLLTQLLTAEDLRTRNIPSYILPSDLRAYPLCYVRADTNSIMTVQPTYNLPTEVECFHLVHMINNRGFPFSMDTPARTLVWAWTMMLLGLEKESLDSYSNMLEGLEGLDTLSSEQIWHGLRAVLKKMSLLLYIWREDGHSGAQLFYDVNSALTMALELRKVVQEQVSPDPGKFGMEQLSMLFTEEKLYVCPGHAHTWQVNKEITEIPQVILTSHPQFIYSLLLPNNKITQLPGSIFSVLRNLKDLELSTNQLTALPEEIGLCPQLENMAMRKNRLSALPDSFANCKKMARLDISHNHFTKFPAVIFKLTSLRRLCAQDLQLTMLPDDIGELTKLQKLYMNGNCFTSLPASMGQMKNLRDLSLNGVSWYKTRSSNQLLSKSHFEDMLESSNLMRWLDSHDKDKTSLFQQFDEDANGTLDQKEIGKVNANIFHLFPRFGYMGSDPPDDEMPSGFPSVITELEGLEYLSLQYQGLVSVPPEIGRLKNLTALNVNHNPNLLSVAAHAAQLPLKRLEMEDCPVLKTPPKEIRAKGFQSTYAFLKRLLSGSVDCKRTKIMMVGLGGAGKTSLVKALMSDQDKAEMAVGEEITDGIDICPWTVETEEGSLTFSVWDFAGQTVYYNTHQFFLSDRAVYLLLWNIRLGHEHAGLDFWLSSISVHAPKAPIFVVGTHVDQVSKVELPIREMKQRYNQIADFHFVSSFSGQGIRELREEMIEVTLQQQYMGEKIPGVWLGFEDNLKLITDRSVIPYTELEQIANQSGVFEASEVVQAVQFLHELGSVQHFTNDFLKDQVVINPQWIVDVMACVVSVKDSAIKDGRLHHKDIGLVWKDYPQSLHLWLLRLTEEYDLTFPLKDEKVNLVPCLLTEKEPEFEWPEVEKGSGLLETKMTYKFDYLPAGLFNRGQVRLHEFSDSSLVWKRGSYLRKNGHLCLVRQTRGSELVVRAQGPRPENVLFLVHEVFEGLIVESFQGVTYDYLIPCPECLRLYLKDPHMFAASIVRRAAELKAPFLQCLKYFHTISIVDLQACMPPDGTMDFDLHLVQAVRGLKELQRDLAADIFVSFCKKDDSGDKSGAITPAKVLTDVEQLGYRSWVASNASGYSMDEMAKALMDAPLFVAFMTNSYVGDEECCNLFKYARLTLRKPILLVTIGKGFEWRQSKLGILLADEVYINMQQPDRYPGKLEELKNALTDRLKKKVDEGSRVFPPCFISYCWQNSAHAVALGSRSTEGATGYGDPRDIKNYLAEKGIDCWIDVERVGVHGLFEDIGEGLVNAKVVLVCISDQYAASSNCVVEFRFVANTLKLPIVLAVVGSGSKWRATEVGVLSQNYPVVSFQESQTPAVYDRLVQLIQPYMTSDTGVKSVEKGKGTSKDQKSHSFQELCELAQRKFLRQLVVYAEVQDMLTYPRLFLVDFAPVEGETGEKGVMEGGESGGEAKEETEGKKHLSGADFREAQFIVNFLCEHDEGWHVSGTPMVMQPEFSAAIEEYAPFASRISAIAKYSRKLALNCMMQPLGKLYLQWLEKSPHIAEASDFQHSYHKLRQTVAEADERRGMGGLARCHLSNGRMVWLCENHRQNNRVTVLSDSDTVSSSSHAKETIGVDYFLQALREIGPSDTSKPDFRPESRMTDSTPLPPLPEESVAPQPSSSAASNSKVKDTSTGEAARAQPPVSKRTSKSRMKSAEQSSSEPPKPLQRQPSQLKFTPNKSRACVVM